MSPENDALLVECYPRVFANQRASVHESPLAFGFENGDGWFALIDTLCAALQTETKRGAPQVIAFQVKEKFGALCFYTRGPVSDRQRAMIDLASRLSKKTCEKCGCPGECRPINGWYRTRCGRCAQLEVEARAEESEYFDTARKAVIGGLVVHESRAYWKMPAELRGTSAEVPTILAGWPNPFDLVDLASRWSIEDLRSTNDQLLVDGRISAQLHARTARLLDALARGGLKRSQANR